LNLRYIVCFFPLDHDLGYIKDIQSGGYFFVTLEHGDISYFAYIVTPQGYRT